MSNHPFANRRPTPLEDRAYAEARQQFTEHLKQFPASREAMQQLERNMTKTALAVDTAASQPPPPGNPILTGDGSQWHKAVDLFDKLWLGYRLALYAKEYAVAEQFPNGRHEIWNRGYNALEVLRAFANEQSQALQIWTDDITRQVQEFLAEKYPGQDMSRVADTFVLKCTTQAVSEKHTLTHNNGQKYGGGIHI